MSYHKIRCKKCQNEQMVFSRAKTEVRCLVCEALLASPTGGKLSLEEFGEIIS